MEFDAFLSTRRLHPIYGVMTTTCILDTEGLMSISIGGRLGELEAWRVTRILHSMDTN